MKGDFFMSEFFKFGLLSEILGLLPVKPVSEPEGSEIAKEILANVSAKDIKKDAGMISFGGVSKEYKFYSFEERQAVAEAVKSEMLKKLGVIPEVFFEIVDQGEEEPDPIPPLYWGEKDQYYIYQLQVQIEVA